MKYHISFRQDLKRNLFKGKYYAFEGIDGCGKSTQVESIKRYFENQGKKVVVTSEPQAEGVIQKIIRDALFSKVYIPSRAYQDLYSADRAENHLEIVTPALKRGDIVLSHRSIWSTPAYGLFDLHSEESKNTLYSVLVSQGNFSLYHQFLCPDKTFYLRVSAKHAAERLSTMEKKKDIYEKEEKLAKIVRNYEYVIKEFPAECVAIDGEKSEEEVTKEIIQNL